MKRFPGIHCVLYALFDDAGELDREAMGRQMECVQRPGVHGINVLGLATEVQKLTGSEKQQIISWAAADLHPGVGFSVTISGNSVAEQSALAAFAVDHGAGMLILQPPMVGAFSPDQYLDFFCRVGDTVDLPMAIQNAPQYLGRSLSDADIAELGRRNSNFTHIKAETSAVDLSALIQRCGSSLTVLNGRGGLEMTDCLRVGCEGFLVASDIIDHVARVYDLWNTEEPEASEAAYAEFLPAALFAMQSIEALICYGKRIFGLRAGLQIHDRGPALIPTSQGLRLAENWAAKLGRI